MGQVAKWLERTLTIREVSGSIQGLDGHKNLCGDREPSDYVSLRKAVKIQRFHTRKIYDTRPRATQQHFLTKTIQIRTGSRSTPNIWRSFPPE